MSDSPSAVSHETTIMNESNKNGEPKSHARSTSAHVRYDKFQATEIKDLLLIFLFVVKYLSEEQLVAWWQQSTEGEVVSFFATLEVTLNCFKYVGKRNIEVVKSQSMDNVKNKTTKAHTLPARMNPSEINHENTGTLVIHTVSRDTQKEPGKYM